MDDDAVQQTTAEDAAPMGPVGYILTGLGLVTVPSTVAFGSDRPEPGLVVVLALVSLAGLCFLLIGCVAHGIVVAQRS